MRPWQYVLVAVAVVWVFANDILLVLQEGGPNALIQYIPGLAVGMVLVVGGLIQLLWRRRR
jgi:uncharacterized membrane protein YpjA